MKQRVAELEKENKDLKDKVEKLSGELRPMQEKVDKLDLGQQRMEKTLVDARKDLEARVTDMVDQQVHGGRRRVVPQAVPQQRFEEKPYMGFDGQDIEPDVAKLLNLKTKSGVLVTDVREGSPAGVAGLQKNDVVAGVEATEVKVFQDLKNALEGKKPADVITLKVRRGEETLEMKLTLGTRRVPVGD